MQFFVPPITAWHTRKRTDQNLKQEQHANTWANTWANTCSFNCTDLLLTIQSCNCWFIHSFFPSFVRASVQWFIHLLIQSVSQSVSQSSIHSFIHAFIRSFIQSFIHSFIHSYNPSPIIYTLIGSLLHLLMRSFHSVVHLLVPPYQAAQFGPWFAVPLAADSVEAAKRCCQQNWWQRHD